MQITYYGAEMVKLSVSDFTVVFNPISKGAKTLKAQKVSADLVFISRNLPEFNGKEEASKKDGSTFIIDGPGEYEIKGVFAKGTKSKSEFTKPGINTIYTIQLDNMNIVFLGALSEEKPNMEFAEDLDEIDILFVPIGGDGVLDPSGAHKLAVSLEPKIIIPIHWAGLGQKGALEQFTKEYGADATQEEKLTIKKKDLDGKQGELVILKSKI